MSMKCDVCQVTLNSSVQFQQHLLGQGHAKKVKLQQEGKVSHPDSQGRGQSQPGLVQSQGPNQSQGQGRGQSQGPNQSQGRGRGPAIRGVSGRGRGMAMDQGEGGTGRGRGGGPGTAGWAKQRLGQQYSHKSAGPPTHLKAAGSFTGGLARLEPHVMNALNLAAAALQTGNMMGFGRGSQPDMSGNLPVLGNNLHTPGCQPFDSSSGIQPFGTDPLTTVQIFGNNQPFGNNGQNFGNNQLFGNNGQNFGNNQPFGHKGQNFGNNQLFGNNGQNFGNNQPFGNKGQNFGNNQPFGNKGQNFGNSQLFGNKGQNYGNSQPFENNGQNFGNGGRIFTNNQPFGNGGSDQLFKGFPRGGINSMPGFGSSLFQGGCQRLTWRALKQAQKAQRPRIPPPPPKPKRPKPDLSSRLVVGDNMGVVAVTLEGEDEMYCNICCVTMTSPDQAYGHYRGSKHLRKARISRLHEVGALTEETQDNPVGEFYCSYCNITVNSVEQLTTHQQGTRHKKMLENRKRKAGNLMDCEPEEKRPFPSSWL